MVRSSYSDRFRLSRFSAGKAAQSHEIWQMKKASLSVRLGACGVALDARGELPVEQRQHALEGGARRVSGLVPIFEREPRVRPGLDAVRVAEARVELHADEAIAQLALEPLEARARRHLIGAEAQAEHAQVLGG